MFAREALHHVALSVTDMDRAAWFYGTVLGLQEIPRPPFDFGGAYDESSDRQRTMSELIQLGYEDAYRQFIETVAATA